MLRAGAGEKKKNKKGNTPTGEYKISNWRIIRGNRRAEFVKYLGRGMLEMFNNGTFLGVGVCEKSSLAD